MLSIINEYTKNDMQVTEYTKDGITVSHVVETPINTEPIEPQEPQVTIEEEILYETKYQTLLLEMGGM